MSIEVVCRRERYLDARMTFAVVPATEVELEAGTKWRPPAGEAAAGFAANVAVQLFPPVLLLEALAVKAAEDTKPNPPYAYRALPEFLLTPESLASEADRECFLRQPAGAPRGRRSRAARLHRRTLPLLAMRSDGRRMSESGLRIPVSPR